MSPLATTRSASCVRRFVGPLLDILGPATPVAFALLEDGRRGRLVVTVALETTPERAIEEESFDGHRYAFEVLVETPDTAVSYGAELHEIFDEGLVLERSEQLHAVRRSIYAESRGGA